MSVKYRSPTITTKKDHNQNDLSQNFCITRRFLRYVADNLELVFQSVGLSAIWIKLVQYKLVELFYGARRPSDVVLHSSNDFKNEGHTFCP